ncbi:ABC transporter permease [Nakamurella lactea]|uniref:ABC transporter permease n=1 Tax=Nakamurella lactea TaxID=459515 RepID=UPI0003FEF30A|nr:iron ABC transporter permease [Nakamurella lactea]
MAVADPIERPADPIERPADPIERPADPIERPAELIERPAGLIERPADRALAVGRRVGLVLLAAVPLVALGLFFCYPVVALIGRGLWSDSGLDLGAFADVFGRSRMRSLVVFTIWQAAVSAGLCLLLGIPGAYLLYRCRFRGQAVLRALVTVPFVLPTVVVGLAFRTLFAADGPLGSWGWDGSLAVVLAAHVFLNYAVVVRTVGATWAVLDERPAQAARSLGAGGVRTFLTVTVPALGPAIAGAAAMVFLFCATSFGVMLILGGSKFRTLETEIYRQTTDIFDLRTAAVLSITQIVLVTGVLVLTGLLRRRAEARLSLTGARAGSRRLGREALPALLVTAAVGVAFLAPMLVMVLRSLQTPTGWGLGNYRALATLGEDNLMLVPVTDALVNSLRAAAIAAALAVLVGVALCVVLARRPRNRGVGRILGAVDTVMMLPLGVSAVTVGFGFLIALDRPPLDLRGSALLVPIAQAMVALPLVVRMVLPVLRAADDRLRQAAATLGAPPLRVWTGVDLPLMARALAGAAAFAFAVSLGEFGATSFLARPQTPTLPVVIVRLISRPGAANTGTALAAATVLALACALVMVAVDTLAGARNAARIGGF